MSQAQALTTRMTGPAQQTVVERFVGRLPLPYVPASLLLAALLGPPGYVLFRYFDAGTFAGALTGYFAGMVPAAYLAADRRHPDVAHRHRHDPPAGSRRGIHHRRNRYPCDPGSAATTEPLIHPFQMDGKLAPLPAAQP